MFSRKVQLLLTKLATTDRNAREKPSAVLGYEHGFSSTTILKVLKRNGFKSSKPTKKPGLTPSMMEARYQFALRFEHWEIEDWKKVIWTDEISVCIGSRRGRKIRVWRTIKEMYHKTCIRTRYKSFQEFMFWGSFRYDKKGPCHIWNAATAK